MITDLVQRFDLIRRLEKRGKARKIFTELFHILILKFLFGISLHFERSLNFNETNVGEFFHERKILAYKKEKKRRAQKK